MYVKGTLHCKPGKLYTVARGLLFLNTLADVFCRAKTIGSRSVTVQATSDLTLCRKGYLEK